MREEGNERGKSEKKEGCAMKYFVRLRILNSVVDTGRQISLVEIYVFKYITKEGYEAKNGRIEDFLEYHSTTFIPGIFCQYGKLNMECS